MAKSEKAKATMKKCPRWDIQKVIRTAMRTGEKAGMKDAVKAFAYMNGEYGEGKVNNDGSTDAKDKNSD